MIKQLTDHQTFLKNQCTKIKILVQNFTGIPDIGIKSNRQIISDAKKIYCKIAHDNTKASYNIIASALRKNYNHASVIHSINKFNDLYPLKQLINYEAYNHTMNALSELSFLDYDNVIINEKIKEYSDFLQWVKLEYNNYISNDIAFTVKKYLAMKKEM